jgi:(p)ppGpp synthase/HD superfamily hydrolase
MKAFSAETIKAFNFAREAHKAVNQKRKYSGEDYIIHPIRVVDILVKAGENNQELFQAAFLHDVLEDVAPVLPYYSAETIEQEFGSNVVELVKELTDEFTSTSYPTTNRPARKKLEAERLGRISDNAKKIKLADLIDNTSDIMANDKGFAKVYIQEKKKVLDEFAKTVSVSSDPVLRSLFAQAYKQVHAYNSEQHH